MHDIEDIEIAACKLALQLETSLDEFSESEKKLIIFKCDIYQKEFDKLFDRYKRTDNFNDKIAIYKFVYSIQKTASKRGLELVKLQRKITTNK